MGSIACGWRTGEIPEKLVESGKVSINVKNKADAAAQGIINSDKAAKQFDTPQKVEIKSNGSMTSNNIKVHIVAIVNIVKDNIISRGKAFGNIIKNIGEKIALFGKSYWEYKYGEWESSIRRFNKIFEKNTRPIYIDKSDAYQLKDNEQKQEWYNKKGESLNVIYNSTGEYRVIGDLPYTKDGFRVESVQLSQSNSLYREYVVKAKDIYGNKVEYAVARFPCKYCENKLFQSIINACNRNTDFSEAMNKIDRSDAIYKEYKGIIPDI